MELNPNENVFYPMPFVDGEAHLLVITNQRVIHFGDTGKQEMPARQIQFVGRMSGRPMVAAGIICAILALPMIGLGVYWIATSGVFSSKSIPTIPGDDPSQPQSDAPVADEDAPPPPPESGVTKVLGFVFVPLGLVMLIAGILMVRVQRHFVLLRGGAMVIQIRAANPMEQTQILATVGALQSSSKGAAAAAPAPKAVKVDDKGDPVKALQDLAKARAEGKVSEEEFEAKREVLVQRVRARK